MRQLIGYFTAGIFFGLTAFNSYAADPAKVKALEEFVSRSNQHQHVVYVRKGQTGVVDYITGLVELSTGKPDIEILIAKEFINGSTNFILAQRLDYNKILVIRDNRSDGTANETKVRIIRSGSTIDSYIVALIDNPTSNETDPRAVESGQKVLDIAVDKLHEIFIKN